MNHLYRPEFPAEADIQRIMAETMMGYVQARNHLIGRSLLPQMDRRVEFQPQAFERRSQLADRLPDVRPVELDSGSVS